MSDPTYPPLDTPKPVARDIWVVDGPVIRFYKLPFSTRATILRLENGDIWLHSPTRWSPELQGRIAALGPIRHLIAPNWIHYAYIADWQKALPQASAGHQQYVAQVREALAQGWSAQSRSGPRLYAVGSWFAGTGLARVIPDARAVAGLITNDS